MVCSKYKNQPVELSFCFFVLFSRGQSIAFKWNGKKDGRRIRPSSNKSLNKTTQEQGQEMHQPHHHQHRHQQHFDYSDCDKRPGGHETVSFNSSKKCKKGIGIIAFSEMVFFHCNFILSIYFFQIHHFLHFSTLLMLGMSQFTRVHLQSLTLRLLRQHASKSDRS